MKIGVRASEIAQQIQIGRHSGHDKDRQSHPADSAQPCAVERHRHQCLSDWIHARSQVKQLELLINLLFAKANATADPSSPWLLPSCVRASGMTTGNFCERVHKLMATERRAL